MKKLIVVLSLILLCACSSNYFKVSVDDLSITVGKDNEEVLKDNEKIYCETYTKDDKKIISKVEIYLRDFDDSIVKINDYELTKGIKESCSDLSGEYIEANGEACLINSGNRKSYAVLHDDILSDDLDKIDRIEVVYIFE